MGRRSVLALLLVLGLLVTINFEQSFAKEAYLKVNPKELPFEFASGFREVSFGKNGYEIKGGTVKKFTLAGQSVDLLTDEIASEKGELFINTKNFGKVKFTLGSDMTAELWLTPAQQKKFKEFINSKKK